MTRFTFVFTLLVVLSVPAFSQEEKDEGVQITVYNNDLAVVKDRRKMEIPEGVGKVEFTDVATRIDATSVRFESLTDPNTSVLEQNYEYDLVGPSKLLEKYIDEQVRLFTKDGELHEGKLLSQAEGQIVLQEEEDGQIKIVTGGENIYRVELMSLPEGLITRPTLVWETRSEKGGEQLCQVSYMTNGIGWSADYLAVVNEDDTGLDLTGWVTLDNQSGATYEQAKLKLIAGDVQRVQERGVQKMRAFAMEDSVAAAPPQFEEKSFFEYHLYTLQRPTTIKQAQTKQVQLLSADDVKGEKTYTYNGSRNGEKVEVKMKFKNSEENNMGMPLPGGKVRAFKMDSDGSLEFVGEDRIDHTPRQEEVELKLGNAFDIVGERKQTDHKTIVQNRINEDSYEIELRNRKKDEAVTIRVEEPVWGDWEVIQSSEKPQTEDANTLYFEVDVPADTVKTVTYTVRTKR
ncbi:MAG: DUF4139 domain-containing protein [Candidatus Omnitrophica bacterium]|nr:DUF4139 domain-containing protein [Candidatus Omnitrophota bacterium]